MEHFGHETGSCYENNMKELKKLLQYMDKGTNYVDTSRKRYSIVLFSENSLCTSMHTEGTTKSSGRPRDNCDVVNIKSNHT